MEQSLIARLLAAAPLAALVGQRITWGQRPQKEPLPGATLLLVSPGRAYVHGAADGLAGPRVQIDIYAETFLQAKQIARVIRDTLEVPATQGSIAFSASFLDSERGPIIEDTGGGRKVHRISQDYFVWFSPA